MAFNTQTNAAATTTVSPFNKAKTVGFLNLCHKKPDGSAGASIGTVGISFTDKQRDAGTVKTLNEDSDAAIARLVAKITSGEIIFTWHDLTAEKAPAEAAF